MTTIIVAIGAGLILLWGGIIGLLKLVDLFEQKHILSLGAFATLVTALVLGLVLFTIQERQKQHRHDMAKQIDAVTAQLNDLSNRMLAQLEEKANLTASEFQIRSNLQHEKADHNRTRDELATQIDELQELEKAFARERQRNRKYQADQNRAANERFQQLEGHNAAMQEWRDRHERATQNMQKQLATVQADVGKLNNQTAGLQTQQNSLLGKVTAAKQIQDLNAQKLDALAHSLQALHEALAPTITAVDSLYKWEQ